MLFRLNQAPLGIVTQHIPIVSDSAVASGSPSQHGIMSMPGIISMPAILQTCSLRTRAVPAITLPPTTSTKTRDESRFSIANLKLSREICQGNVSWQNHEGLAL
jgi:hypothetical protein